MHIADWLVIQKGDCQCVTYSPDFTAVQLYWNDHYLPPPPMPNANLSFIMSLASLLSVAMSFFVFFVIWRMRRSNATREARRSRRRVPRLVELGMGAIESRHLPRQQPECVMEEYSHQDESPDVQPRLQAPEDQDEIVGVVESGGGSHGSTLTRKMLRLDHVAAVLSRDPVKTFVHGVQELHHEVPLLSRDPVKTFVHVVEELHHEDRLDDEEHDDGNSQIGDQLAVHGAT
jgi:hypothetical protein